MKAPILLIALASVCLGQVEKGDLISLALKDGAKVEGTVEIVSGKSVAVDTGVGLKVLSLRNLKQEDWDKVFGADNPNVIAERKRLVEEEAERVAEAKREEEQRMREAEDLARKKEAEGAAKKAKEQADTINALFANPLILEAKIRSLRTDWKDRTCGWKPEKAFQLEDAKTGWYCSYLSVDTTRGDIAGVATVTCGLESRGKGNRVSVLQLNAHCVDLSLSGYKPVLLENPTMRIYGELVRSVFAILGQECPEKLADVAIKTDTLEITYEKKITNKWGGYFVNIEILLKE